MRKGGGKAKGAEFERQICKKLSLWVSEGKNEDCYWRSAMSGGRSTVAHTKGKKLGAQAGDISCIHPLGQPTAELFFFEAKFYRDLELLGLLKGKGKLVNFWKEAKKQAKNYGKIPFLIAKQNRIPTFVCLNRSGLTALGLYPALAALTAPALDMYVYDMEWFFANCTPIRVKT